jgi:hypothetical protein
MPIAAPAFRDTKREEYSNAPHMKKGGGRAGRKKEVKKLWIEAVRVGI